MCVCPPAAREMSDELQALCYFAGANSIFYGDRLLTTPNAGADRDLDLFDRLGLSFEEVDAAERPCRTLRAVEAH